MPTTVSSGTTSALTLDTPTSLATSTLARVFVCQWNLDVSAKGDLFRLYVKTKVLTGDTAEIIWEYAGIGGDLGENAIIHSPPICSMFSIDMGIEQTDGTGRAIPWALISLATPSTVASATEADIVVDTPESLATTTTAGTYVGMVNMTNLADDDAVEFYFKTKVLTGDTAVVPFRATYRHNMGANPIVQSEPIISMFSLEMLLLQTDGTARSFPWSLLRIDA